MSVTYIHTHTLTDTQTIYNPLRVFAVIFELCSNSFIHSFVVVVTVTVVDDDYDGTPYHITIISFLFSFFCDKQQTTTDDDDDDFLVVWIKLWKVKNFFFHFRPFLTFIFIINTLSVCVCVCAPPPPTHIVYFHFHFTRLNCFCLFVCFFNCC